MSAIKRIYVRRYRDNDSVVAYVDWHSGARTEGRLHRYSHPHHQLIPTFGVHMHALFARGKREGLRLEREVW